ncbi:MAG TPA: hypothetical protein VMV89_03730 [Candidatus Paceibacterota bacterium]|nr:hypothetical protein [Candidatus Paceibacterota bacterium]
MKPKLHLCLALVLSGGLINCPADTDTSADATNILRNLFTNKTLVLSSRQKFIIQTSQNQGPSGWPTFANVDIVAPKMIRQFGFKAELSRPDHPTTVMRVAANENHTTVLIETSEGQPYCLMADHFLVICDSDNPGGLAYCDGGTVLWGLFQSMDRTNTSFQMMFVATNVPPAAILDLSFVIKGAFAEMTNASYQAGSRTIRIQTKWSSREIELSDANSHDLLGVKEVKIHGDTAAFDFSDFRIDTTPIKGLFQFSKHDLQKLNLPLRALNSSEFGHLEISIPEGFPDTEATKAAAEKLQSLIASHQPE